MKTLTKEKSLQVLVSELDTVFSLFIRLRDSDQNGVITCFVTGERVHYRQSDAAHYIHRSAMPTRFDEMNVHACTVETNRFDNPHDHQRAYRYKMNKKYGDINVLALELKAKGLQKFMRSDFREMIEHYKSEVSKLKRLKGI